MNTSQLMPCTEMIAVCLAIHTKHINTLCGQNVELLHVKRGGMYSNHCALKARHSPLMNIQKSQTYETVTSQPGETNDGYAELEF
jgi:hypothetical protein